MFSFQRLLWGFGCWVPVFCLGPYRIAWKVPRCKRGAMDKFGAWARGSGQDRVAFAFGLASCNGRITSCPVAPKDTTRLKPAMNQDLINMPHICVIGYYWGLDSLTPRASGLYILGRPGWRGHSRVAPGSCCIHSSKPDSWKCP